MSKPDLSRLASLFSIDLRSLALARILLGTLIVVDCLWRLPFTVELLSQNGWLPYEVLKTNPLGFSTLTLYTLTDWPLWPPILLVVQIGVALLFILGWKTRWVTLILWLLVLSLHFRNPFLLQGGDSYLRVILFWALFLPLGDRWSLDARLKPPTSDAVFSLATAGLLFQIAAVYFFSGLLKNSSEWRSTGEAVYNSLLIYDFATPLGTWLTNFPQLLQTLTPYVLWFEIAGPLLLFAPWALLRTTGVFLFLALQIGFGTSLWLGLFPFISSVAVLVFLPSAFWNRLAKIWPAAQSTGQNLHISLRPIPTTVAGVFLLLILTQNISTLPDQPKLPAPLSNLLKSFGLRQKWDMFAPHPLDSNGYFVWAVQLSTGQWVDLKDPTSPPRWERPDKGPFRFPTYRMRKYLHNLRDPKYKHAIAPYIDYHWRALLQDWKKNHPHLTPVSLALYHANVSIRKPQPHNPPKFDFYGSYPEPKENSSSPWPQKFLPPQTPAVNSKNDPRQTIRSSL